MKLHVSAPAPFEHKHRLLVADGQDSIDDSHITLAALTRYHEQFLRTAQVYAQVSGSRLKIIGIQGAGPLTSFRRAGVRDPKAFFDRFRRDMGLKPINTLLAALVLEARERGFEEAVWTGEDRYELKPDSILNALRFRKNRAGIYQLPLQTPEAEITKRLVGQNAEKRALFEAIRLQFGGLLGKISFGR